MGFYTLHATGTKRTPPTVETLPRHATPLHPIEAMFYYSLMTICHCGVLQGNLLHQSQCDSLTPVAERTVFTRRE